MNMIWTAFNLVAIIGIIIGFILLVVAVWRQSTAQKRIADTLEMMAARMGNETRE